MKSLDNLVAKIGVDKILHFAIGGLLCSVLWLFAMAAGVNWWLGWILSALVVTGISFYKEYLLDSAPDLVDIIYADCGCGFPLLAWLLGMLL